MWLVLLAHVFKYPAFEYGPRYALATGHSLIHGYGRVPGPKQWAVWAFLGTTMLQGFTISAGTLAITAAILHAVFAGLTLGAWTVIIGVVIVALLIFGRYQALEVISKGAMGVLVLISVLAFSVALPSAGEWGQMVVPQVPAGSGLLAAAILGIMPTGINVAIWHSLWALEHEKAWLADGSTRAQALAKGRFDLLVGYGVSALLAVIFVALGAELLRPRGLVPQGIDVALTLSEIYTEVLGSWMLSLFLLAAFLALFSTAYSVMDGFPRTFAMLLRELLPEQRWVAGQGTYWGFMAAIFLVAIAANTLFPNPVTLVQWVGVVSLAVAPLLYGLNWYCVNRLIEDRTLAAAALPGDLGRLGGPGHAWGCGGGVLDSSGLGLPEALPGFPPEKLFSKLGQRQGAVVFADGFAIPEPGRGALGFEVVDALGPALLVPLR